MARMNNVEIGVIGEYYAAAQLSAMGYRVSMTLGNNKEFDLYVSDDEKAIMVQVKTTRGLAPEWVVPLIEKAKPNLVYVFVNLNPAGDCPCPSFHIATSKDVKKFLDDGVEKYREEYKKRNNGKGPDETARGVNSFKDREGKYLDKWQNLGLKLLIAEDEGTKDKKPSTSKKEKGKKAKSREQ